MQVAKIKKKNKNGLLFVYVKKKQYLCAKLAKNSEFIV